MLKRLSILVLLLGMSAAGSAAADSSLNDAGKRVGETVGKARDEAVEIYDRTAEAVGQAAETISERGRKVLERAESAVREFGSGVEQGISRRHQDDNAPHGPH